jgi:predicted phage tail protein
MTESTKPLVTTLTPISQQVGENLITALQTQGTVAVLSTIVAGVPTDRLVSLPLSLAQLNGVQGLLSGLQATPSPSKTDDPQCIGFHCQLPQADD